jgi:acetyltransferase-like isoleucine patch superfamily enzyme
VLLFFLPWPIRRYILAKVFGFQIDPSARIGYSLVLCRSAILKPRAQIRHLTVIRGLDLLQMEENSVIGNLNAIQGSTQDKRFFRHQPERRAELIVGQHSAITSRHYIDCTNRIVIGKFTTIAGVKSTFLTHSIDLRMNRQDSAPITIGDYCFVGSDCTVLKGAELPSYSVLGAKALLNKAYAEPGLYAGVPARHIAGLDEDMKYMVRESGYIF